MDSNCTHKQTHGRPSLITQVNQPHNNFPQGNPRPPTNSSAPQPTTTHKVSTLSARELQNNWQVILNPHTSAHTCNDLSKFTSYQSAYQMYTSACGPAVAAGHGTVKILVEMTSGQPVQLILEHVYHMPNARTNTFNVQRSWAHYGSDHYWYSKSAGCLRADLNMKEICAVDMKEQGMFLRLHGRRDGLPGNSLYHASPLVFQSGMGFW